MKQLFIVDASGFIYRSYFAIQGLSNAKGASTNALFGFIRTLLKLIDDFHPDHIVCVFDGEKNKQSRTEIYQEYKAHRKATPPDLIEQLFDARTFCTLFGIPILDVPHVEADDTMATCALWAKDFFDKIYICTQDKDMCQVVQDNIFLLNVFKNNLIVDEKGVIEQFGIYPKQMIDYLSLIGDASDNIPGVKGCGPKTAQELLKKYGTLDELYAHIHELPEKKKNLFEQERDRAYLSKRLVEVNTEVAIPKQESFYYFTQKNAPELISFLKDKQFESILKTLQVDNAQKSSPVVYELVDTEEKLYALIQVLEAASEICVDTETTSISPFLATLVGIGFCIEPQKAYYVPFNGTITRDVLDKVLQPFFNNPKNKFFGHNIKYDIHVLKRHGFSIANVFWDTILASYVLNAHLRKHSLDELVLENFGHQKIATEELIGKGVKQITMDQVSIEKVAEYCCEDVDYTFRLKQLLEKKLHDRGLDTLFNTIEMPLVHVLVQMEERGIYVDTDVLKRLTQEVAFEIAKIEHEIRDLSGGIECNLNSPKQLSDLLYNKLELPAPKKKTKQPSTAADILEDLVPYHPIISKILEYRSLEKLRSTYLEALVDYIHPETRRIHCQFNQSVAATGRLSSQDPNLQNIPVRTTLGKAVRSAFCPQEPNWIFISGDYSQIELRILAHVTEDPGLLRAFHDGIDVHAYTAAEIFHVSYDEVTEDMRRRAKAVNFGVIYGQQAFGLSRELHIPLPEAQKFIDLYFKRYKRVKEYIEEAKEFARKNGRAVTLTGRERIIPDILSSNGQIRAQAERLAVNTPFQGTAADIIKIAMLEVHTFLKREQLQSKILLQIHDELLLEMPISEQLILSKELKKIMEQVYSLKVPLIVEINIGKNWQEC